MITITGNILDASANPIHVLIEFKPTSAPFIIGSDVISPQVVQIKSNANDGGFSVALEPGNYSVTYRTSPQFSFGIVVPSSGGPFSIDEVTSNNPPLPVYIPSGSGSPEGVVSAPPGYPYTDTAGNALYIKMSGTNNTGWQMFIQL